MAERIVAKATLDNGTAFNVELANLTPRSLFIITDRRLSFREHVKLALQGIELEGEVVYVAEENPRGAVLVLEPNGRATSKITRWMEHGEVLHATTPDELWSDSTEPAPEIVDEPTADDAKIDPKLMRAAFLDERPVVIEVDTDEVAKDAFSPEATFQDSGEDTGVELQLPELGSDGTLKFASAADYRAQYTTDIVKGGLIARSPPLPIGTQKFIRMTVPGISDPVSLSARVGFVGSGTVGLMIDSFSKHKKVFDKMFEDLT